MVGVDNDKPLKFGDIISWRGHSHDWYSVVWRLNTVVGTVQQTNILEKWKKKNQGKGKS